MERSMRRFIVLVGIAVAALALGGVPSAVAANPEVNHFTFADSVTDDDFCGTGQTVESPSTCGARSSFPATSPSTTGM
jgi:hypothetical protein